VSLPLEGIKVLDLSRLLPGGFCSLLLADFGADVLKVEDTGMGDYIRFSPPYYEGAHESAKSALFLSLNRNKRSIRLDLKTEPGREVLLRLVREHDVVLESFRPGVLDRLGVGYERMREENPGIVYCAISGYGQSGPKRAASGHDMNYLGLVGLLGLTGELGGEPVQAAGQIADLGGGALMAAFGIMAALHERDGSPARPPGSGSPDGRAERVGSGEGQVVDVSMADGALSWLAMVAAGYFADGTVPRRGDLPLAGSLVCYRPYECADGWVTLGALEPKFWQAWCRGVGREDLIAKQFERPGSDTHAQVQEIFKTRSRADWEAFARKHDCCLEPVLELDEALSSELVREREMVVEIEQPGVQRPVRQLGIPVKLERTPGEPRRLPGPALGEHTEEVLRAAGYSDAEVAELLQAGAVAGPADPAVTTNPAEATNGSPAAPTFRV
jgi:alpha-methylacyl-CoA racemase